MTQNGGAKRRCGEYDEAIAYLTLILTAMNGDERVGLGITWGLQRGQAGWHDVVNARNRLESLRNDMIALNR